MPKFKLESKVHGRHGPPSGLGHLTGDFLLAGRRFHVRSNVCGVEALYAGLGDAFGVIVAADGREPLLVMRLGGFLSARRLRSQAEP